MQGSYSISISKFHSIHLIITSLKDKFAEIQYFYIGSTEKEDIIGLELFMEFVDN